MKLPDHEIISLVNSGVLVVDPFIVDNVQPASLDVTLSNQYLTLEGLAFVDDEYMLKPHECLLGRTVERFVLPSFLVGELAGRSSVGRLFIAVHVTAGYIDPGFPGTLTLELVNLSHIPRPLKAGMRIAQVSFTRMTSSATSPYHGRYVDQIEPTASRL